MSDTIHLIFRDFFNVEYENQVFLETAMSKDKNKHVVKRKSQN